MKRAAAYVRVSTADQVEGYSLLAQERAFVDACGDRGWRPVHVFRDEGVSAHTDQVDRRPGLKALLDAALQHEFEVVVVHSLDRLARNVSVMLQVLKDLGRANVALVSLTEHIDYSTPEGRLFLLMLGGFAEYFSHSLSKHVSKGARERFEQGLHNGPIPFGYAGCPSGCNGRTCGGMHVVPDEASALLDVARRYAVGTITYAHAASDLNRAGFRTRAGKMFTSASVRFLLANPVIAGYVSYKGETRPDRHEAIIPKALFEQLREGRGRRSVPRSTAQRTYLLRGMVACIHCGGLLWSETLKGQLSYYREQRGTRQHEGCPAAGRSVRCEVIDSQVGELFGRLHLPEDWREEIERRMVSHDRRATIEREREGLKERLRRLTTAYQLGNIEDTEYIAQQQAIKDDLGRLRIPEVETVLSAGELLADLRALWRDAGPEQRHELLRLMISRVYVDLLQGRVIGIAPKPAFRDLFAAARTGTPHVLLMTPEETKARLAEANLAVGAGGDGGESNSPSSGRTS